MRLSSRCAAVLAPLCAVAATGCFNLDSKDQIKDLRILAMKMDPPDLNYSFLHVLPAEQRGGLALGPYTINTQVLAVDPKGREVEVSFRLCPDDVDDTTPGCAGYRLRDNAPPEEINALRPLLDPTTFTRSPDLTLGGELPLPTYSFTFNGRGMDYMLPHTADGQLDLVSALGFGNTPSVVVRARAKDGSQEEVSYKRFALGLDVSPEGLPEQFSTFLNGLFLGLLGAGFCPAGTAQDADLNCVKPRVPNRNPTVERVLYKRGGSLEYASKPIPEDPTSDGQFQDWTGRLKVAPGETIRIRPIMAAGDRENYQGLNLDLQTRKVSLKNFREDLVYSWFTTVGSTEQLTTDQFDITPDTKWTPSPDAPDGPAHVWLIVRDQRGGVDWRRFDFDIQTSLISDGGFRWQDLVGAP